MIKFREIDDEYLEYDCLKDNSSLENVEKEVLKEFVKQDLALLNYSKTVGKGITKLAVRKDSIIGKYLLSCQDEQRVLNASKYIDYDKIVNAFNIAIFSSDLETSKLIYPLFINKEEGTYKTLSDKYDLTTLNYILDNPSFKTYLKRDDSTSETKYRVVYEDDRCFLKEFRTRTKTLVKSNNKL